jgi:hypothetical protein
MFVAAYRSLWASRVQLPHSMCYAGEQLNRKSEEYQKVLSLWYSTLYVCLVYSGAPTALMLFAISHSYFVSLGSPLHPCDFTQQTQPQGRERKR